MSKERRDNLLRDVRCAKCGQLLAKEAILLGVLQIKCYNCNEFNTVNFREPASLAAVLDHKDNPSANI